MLHGGQRPRTPVAAKDPTFGRRTISTISTINAGDSPTLSSPAAAAGEDRVETGSCSRSMGVADWPRKVSVNTLVQDALVKR